MKKMIVASTSTVHGSSYLEYLLPTLKDFFLGVKTILFIPYARASGKTYDEYTKLAQEAFFKIDKKVIGIHEFENSKEAIQNAEAIFVGGGNTFELVNQIYKNDVFDVLKMVVEAGTPYLGTSAGSNICGITMMNTNDMPIVYPPSFKTLALLPFNINAHYLEPDKKSTHMGETRETRIKEFHVFNTTSVIGLKEGSWLEVLGDDVFLCGGLSAKLFKKDASTTEIENEAKILETSNVI